ncbi:MAG: dimethyl sulfoxide reductase anchor subunit family protein [Hyphomicrobiaceae bacterium]
MNPAYSVILFTTASGAGYGLLVWLAIGVVTGGISPFDMLGLGGLVLALALITVGLLTSTAHLGRPERAWRAMSQWQTSWLSREAVLALATYIPAGLWLLLAISGVTGAWLLIAVLATATAAGAIVTVWSTGMIYQSLPTIRAWSLPLVAPIYLLLGLASGAALMTLLIKFYAGGGHRTAFIAAVLLLACAVVKWIYWRRIDTMPRTWTAGSATGLGSLGAVHPLELPHTQANFVMREMGYTVARRHADKLRMLTLAVGLVAPAILLLLAGMGAGIITTLLAIVAVAGVGFGVLTERWLFFAEAQHVVSLYYGAERA